MSCKRKREENGEKNEERKERRIVRYGNYSSYYKKRGGGIDKRIEYFEKEWFEEGVVFDIGCNTGKVTMDLSCIFDCINSIFAIDIDPKLIEYAEGYLELRRARGLCINTTISFECRNILEFDPPPSCYSTVLCLSITKWIHLNWGDDGIKKLFSSIFSTLQPGGRLILEWQTFSTYRKKARRVPEHKENLRNIKLFPDMFTQYLLSEIGFIQVKVLVECNKEEKFHRPMAMFLK